MCLEVKENDKPIKARKDKTCYKVVYRVTDVYFETYYQDFPVRLGETYKSELNKHGELVYEGLHSFKLLKQTREFTSRNGCFYPCYVIVKCIIPKGSFYYQGLFDGFISLASTELKYVELMEGKNYV